MCRRIKIPILVFFSSCLLLDSTFGQPGAKPGANEYALVDAQALEIPDSSTTTASGLAAYFNARFTHTKDKTRAAFIWIATNIQYDIANMYALNFYEQTAEKIAKPLKTRKGICENYAALFNDICAKMGIKCFVIEGYTKQNGFADYIPHAWCGAFVDTAWFLFDPTWGSGYVNNGKFYNKINNGYFMMRPAVCIRSHMPFDYLWQFLNYPVTNQAFYEGRTQEDKSNAFFNYTDSIAAFEKQSQIEYYTSAVARIEKNGIKNAMIFDRLEHLRREIEVEKQNRVINLYNSAIADHNKGLNSFNDYINFYNKQFKPTRPDSEIQAMLDQSGASLKAASDKLDKIKSPDQHTSELLASFRKQIADLSGRVDEQNEWLKKYLAKGKMGRKSMFTKYTWFGVPLN
jgi:hypothetical protein